MSKKYKIIYFVSFFVFALFLLFVSIEVKRNFGDLAFLEARFRITKKENLEVHFVQQSKNMVSIDLNSLKGTIPNAITLKIDYDPKTIKITNLFVGDLWTSSNILESNIDEGSSVATITVGQGFDAKLTGKTTIAFLKFQVLNNTAKSTTLNIDKDSHYAVIKMQTLMNVTGRSFSVNLNREL